LRRFLIGAALIAGIAVLAVEGYFVYWFYTSPETLPTANSASYKATPATPDTSEHEMTANRTDGAQNPTSRGTAPSAYAVFVHEATLENISENSTYLDHPVINDNPEAVLHVTQDWNPERGGESYNDHPIGVWYDSDARRWAIVNLDLAEIPVGADFNVVAFRGSTEAS